MMLRKSILQWVPAAQFFGTARRNWRAGVFGVLLLVVVGHGCHGDDVDHEPGLVLPVAEESKD